MLPQKLQNLLDELQLSPEEFGDKIDVGKSSIYKLLRGDTKKLTSRMATKINNAFPNFSLDYLNGLNYDTAGPKVYPSNEPGETYRELHQKEIDFVTWAMKNNYDQLMTDEPFRKEFVFRANEWVHNFPK